MYALISHKDGGLMRISIGGAVICPVFPSYMDAVDFVHAHRLVCKIEPVTVK